MQVNIISLLICDYVCVLLLKWDYSAPTAEEMCIFNLPICQELFPMTLNILLLHHCEAKSIFKMAIPYFIYPTQYCWVLGSFLIVIAFDSSLLLSTCLSSYRKQVRGHIQREKHDHPRGVLLPLWGLTAWTPASVEERRAQPL